MTMSIDHFGVVCCSSCSLPDLFVSHSSDHMTGWRLYLSHFSALRRYLLPRLRAVSSVQQLIVFCSS